MCAFTFVWVSMCVCVCLSCQFIAFTLHRSPRRQNNLPLYNAKSGLTRAAISLSLRFLCSPYQSFRCLTSRPALPHFPRSARVLLTLASSACQIQTLKMPYLRLDGHFGGCCWAVLQEIFSSSLFSHWVDRIIETPASNTIQQNIFRRDQ